MNTIAQKALELKTRLQTDPTFNPLDTGTIDTSRKAEPLNLNPETPSPLQQFMNKYLKQVGGAKNAMMEDFKRNVDVTTLPQPVKTIAKIPAELLGERTTPDLNSSEGDVIKREIARKLSKDRNIPFDHAFSQVNSLLPARPDVFSKYLSKEQTDYIKKANETSMVRASGMMMGDVQAVPGIYERMVGNYVGTGVPSQTTGVVNNNPTSNDLLNNITTNKQQQEAARLRYAEMSSAPNSHIYDTPLVKEPGVINYAQDQVKEAGLIDKVNELAKKTVKYNSPDQLQAWNMLIQSGGTPDKLATYGFGPDAIKYVTRKASGLDVINILDNAIRVGDQAVQREAANLITQFPISSPVNQFYGIADNFLKTGVWQ